jgi:TIR domain
MPFTYSTFISWAHVEGELGNAFVEGLHTALSQEIELYDAAPVYLDRQRLRPGYRFEPALASAMCKSATWVLVFTPRYLKQDFCKRELAAMRALEERRRETLGRHLRREDGLIIPVILRGRNRFPKDISASQYLDLSRYSLARPQIATNRTYADKIRDVADYIARMSELDADGAHDCAAFELPEAPATPDLPPLEFPGRPAEG